MSANSDDLYAYELTNWPNNSGKGLGKEEQGRLDFVKVSKKDNSKGVRYYPFYSLRLMRKYSPAAFLFRLVGNALLRGETLPVLG